MHNAITELTDDRDIQTTVRMSGPLSAINEHLAEQALPVIIEAVSDAVRHSGAQHLTVEIHVADELRIDVTDDGCGIDPTNARHSGLVPVASAADIPPCCAEDQQDGPDNDEDPADDDGDLVD